MTVVVTRAGSRIRDAVAQFGNSADAELIRLVAEDPQLRCGDDRVTDAIARRRASRQQ